MTGEGTRLIAAIVAAVLAAGLLVACGGSDSDSASTESTATDNSTSKATVPEGSDQGAAKKGPKKDAGSQTKSQGDSAGSESAAVATPLNVSGGGSEQFRVKGGDNSIQEYGSERDDSELETAAEVVHGFYVARAEEDWGNACSYLTKAMAAQLEQLAAQSPELRGKGCAAALHAFTRPLPASVRRETTIVDAASLRQEDQQAFLIYTGPEKTVYAMPLYEEDGELKVGALAGNPLS